MKVAEAADCEKSMLKGNVYNFDCIQDSLHEYLAQGSLNVQVYAGRRARALPDDIDRIALWWVLGCCHTP